MNARLGRVLLTLGAVVSAALLFPLTASADCLGCDPAPTSDLDRLAAVALFTVIAAGATLLAVLEARRNP